MKPAFVCRIVLVGSVWLHVHGLGDDEEFSCWQGPFSHELCCAEEHGPGGNAGCWDGVYTFDRCCRSQRGDVTANAAVAQNRSDSGDKDCWHGTFTADFCCGLEFGVLGNPVCWDGEYTYEACCPEGKQQAQSTGCSGEYFDHFRKSVVDYYDDGRVQPYIVKRYPRILANLGEYMDTCAPAALQALLLHLEDRMALDNPEVLLGQVAKYGLRLQSAMQKGQVTAHDLQRWPLGLGLERVHEARQHAGRVAMGRSRNVTLVIAYCREPLDWMRTTLSRYMLPHLGITFVRKCAGVDVLRALPLRGLWRSVDVVDVDDLPLIADECSAYFGYLEQRYERLPHYMVFVHGDAPEHIGALERPNMLDDTLKALVNGVHLPFMHISMNRVTMRWDPTSMSVLWRGLFGDSLVPDPGEVKTYCCSHMVVSRERAQLRSQAWYKHATQFIMGTESYHYLPVGRPRAALKDISCNLPCQNMMFLWHIVFGEGLYTPHRMLDVGLPLFAKVRNVRLKYLEGDGTGKDLEGS
eukprot:TRINITY_DN100774_c0_g1_i1.p1 TRINITY_DN100774_c0_g1~~TRINITY_DN100774_c0_g1_i1.p1  ORF type:complete len:523 (-),score=60.32 TRINITY_DN100774_c0_g1_i1:57-1625(-)